MGQGACVGACERGSEVREDGKVARCGEGNLHAPYFLNLNVSKILLNVWAYKEESSFEG